MIEKRFRTCFLLIILLLVCGCALTGSRTDRSAELLAQDYASMSDKELQTYYKQLSDQLAQVQRAPAGSRGSTGTVTAPVQSGVSKDAPRQTVAEDLRDRWNEVRAELTRRGLRQ
jgi:hypothetical protein